MRHATWVRRNSGPAAIGLAVCGLLMLTPTALQADDTPAAADKPAVTETAPPGQSAADAPKPPTQKEKTIGKLKAETWRTGFSHRQWLNMHIAPVSKALDAQLDLKGEGLLVDHVGHDGPADKAGIQTNDILLAAGDKPLKKPADLESAAGEGKPCVIKLLRAGKPMTVSITPVSRATHAQAIIENLSKELDNLGQGIDVSDIEAMVREKLKDAGAGRLTMHFVQPGKIFPPNFRWGAEFPEDLSLTIRKQGKNPAKIEVKKGDQTWSVKEGDLSSLPADVRPHVEAMLGRGLPLQMLLDTPPRAPRTPSPPGAPSVAVPPEKGVVPQYPPAAMKAKLLFTPVTPGTESKAPVAARVQERLDKRLDELSWRLQEVHDQIDSLRKSIPGAHTEPAPPAAAPAK